MGSSITMCKIHTHTHTHTHACMCVRVHTHTTHTLYILIGVKDNVALRYSKKKNVLSLLLKEERAAECLMSWGMAEV